MYSVCSIPQNSMDEVNTGDVSVDKSLAVPKSISLMVPWPPPASRTFSGCEGMYGNNVCK